MKTYKCLVYGGFGVGNTGDLLISGICLKDMVKQFGDSVAILTSNPGWTSLVFPGFPTIHYLPERLPFRPPSVARRVLRRIGLSRPDLTTIPYKYSDGTSAANENPEWVNQISECECLCLTGGGYLMDLYDCFDYYLLPAAIAKKKKRRIISGPLGIGPLKQPGSLEKLAFHFSSAQIRVRDAVSAELCKRAGLNVEFVLDDGFRCKEVIDFRKPKSRGPSLTIGIDIYQQYGGDSYLKMRGWWVDFLKVIHKKGATVLGFCFHNDPSLDFSETRDCFSLAGLNPDAVSPPFLDFRDSCRQITEFDAIASSRFHPVVVSGSVGTPAIALASGEYYVAKMAAACEGIGTSKPIDPLRTSPTDAAELLFKLVK